jgi:hypothetical protein
MATAPSIESRAVGHSLVAAATSASRMSPAHIDMMTYEAIKPISLDSRSWTRPASCSSFAAYTRRATFNATAGSDVAALMAEHFDLLHAAGVDLIWAGQAASFPGCGAAYQAESESVVDLVTDGLCDVHNVPRVTLRVDQASL